MGSQMTNTGTKDNDVAARIPKELANEIDRIIERARDFRTAHT